MSKKTTIFRSNAKCEITYAGDTVVPSSLVQGLTPNALGATSNIGEMLDANTVIRNHSTKNEKRSYVNVITVWGYNPITSIEGEYPIDMDVFTPADVNEYTHLIVKESVTIINMSGPHMGRGKVYELFTVHPVGNSKLKLYPFYKI